MTCPIQEDFVLQRQLHRGQYNGMRKAANTKVVESMFTTPFPPVSALRNANQLFRERQWEAAVRAYLDQPQPDALVRELIRANLALLLRSAPHGSLSADSADRARAFLDGMPQAVPEDHRLKAPLSCAAGAHRSDLATILRDGLGVEQVYVVNLSHRADRHVRVLREMTKWGVPITRIDGVDARLSERALRDLEAFQSRPVGERRPSSVHVSEERMTRYKTEVPLGAFGYNLSQARVINDARRAGFRRILVLDDDVFFSSDAVERLTRLAPALPEKLKVLMLGASEYSNRHSETFKASRLPGCDDLYRPVPGLTCGSFAVVYDQSAYEEVLQAIDEADGTYDNVVLGSLYHRHPDQCLAVDPAIGIPDVGDSDIRPNARAQEAHSKRMRWEFRRYGEFTAPFGITVVVSSLDSLRTVETLRHELPSETFLNLCYRSSDGVRSVVTGHHFSPRDSTCLPWPMHDATELRQELERAGVPHADVVIAWPTHLPVTEDTAVTMAARALDAWHRSASRDVSFDGFVCCVDAGRRAVKGRHSIIIPSFRAVEHVWPTVQSALQQDAADVEVIVVSDNPEHTEFALDLSRLAREWSTGVDRPELARRLTVLAHQRNRNASAARNTGLWHSSGEYVSFLDDDDLFAPARLSAVEPVLAGAGAGVAACYCGYSGTWNGEPDPARFPEGDLGDRVLTLRYAEHYMCTNTVSFRRESLVRLGGFNEAYGRHQDLELMTRFFEHFRIAAVQRFLVQNRPVPVPQTFVADLAKLCHLKQQFLSDFRGAIVARGTDFTQQVIEAHLKDITKKYKKPPEELLVAARAFLSASLRV